MDAVWSGYARCSTDGQDLTAQRGALARLGVDPERIYTDHGPSGCTPTSSARPGSAVSRVPSVGGLVEIASRVPQDLIVFPACLEKGCMGFRDRLRFMDD